MESEQGPVGRVIKHGSQQYTRVEATDEPGYGNACHHYRIVNTDASKDEKLIFNVINFQDGPVKEHGVNGIHNEDLLVIVVDRLEGFQGGIHACRENALALTKIQEALHWLNHRTTTRQQRGVEGTHKI